MVLASPNAKPEPPVFSPGYASHPEKGREFYVSRAARRKVCAKGGGVSSGYETRRATSMDDRSKPAKAIINGGRAGIAPWV